jgi:hypothetical protein
MSAAICDQSQRYSSHKLLVVMFKCPDYYLFKWLEQAVVAWWKQHFHSSHTSTVNSTMVHKNEDLSVSDIILASNTLTQ